MAKAIAILIGRMGNGNEDGMDHGDGFHSKVEMLMKMALKG